MGTDRITRRKGRSVLRVLVALFLLSGAQMAAADTHQDCGSKVVVLGTNNCGDLKVTVSVDGGTCYQSNTTYYTCKVNVVATATADRWLNPGGVTARITSPCSSSASRSWNIGGTSPTDPATTSCSAWMDFARGECQGQSGSAEASYTGLSAPGDLAASAQSDAYCAPGPTGPAVTLYQHYPPGGCERSFDSSVSNLDRYDYANCPGRSMNDDVSSLKVREWCTVVLYVDAYEDPLPGRSFPAGTHYVGDDINDEVSSMKVSCL